jgi:hypothetical protein
MLTTVGIANIATLQVTGTASVTGNANVGNLGTAGLVTATGNITGGNLDTAGLIVATGNITGGNLVTAGSGNIGSLTVTANANVGNLGTAGLIVATGNITGGNLNTAGLASVTGNVIGGNLVTTGAVATGTLVTTSDVTVGGNLVVNGDLIYDNITTLAIEDPIIGLGRGANNAPLTTDDNKDRGTHLWYYDTAEKSAFFGWDDSTGKLIAAANVTIANEIVTVNDYGNFVIGGLESATISVTANATVGNLGTAGQVTATANITGGNLITTGSGNIGSLTVTANANVGNLGTAGLIVATGNITGGNLTTVGIANIATLEVTGAATVASTLGVTGNATVGNLSTAGLITATGNVTAGNLNTAGLASVTGNVIGGNLSTAGLITATGNITGGNINTAGSVNVGNITIAGNDILSTSSELTINDQSADVNFRVEGNSDANLLFLDAGTDQVVIGSATPVAGAKFQIATTDSMLLPTGNTAQRPGTGTVGMLRFSTAADALEAYTADGWETVGVPAFTVIASETFNGDGSTVAFTLSDSQTTASCIVSINGVIQLPSTAYSVSTVTLTFTEAPLSGDVIEVRKITTTTTVAFLENASGNGSIAISENASQINATGNLLPISNNVYSLGSASSRWKDLFLTGNTLTLGNIVMKNTSGNSIAFFGADGTTPATLDANIDVTADAIASGTSNVSFAASGGNVLFVAGGTTTGIITSSGANITGTLNATGNITGSYFFGNGSQLTGIDATSIQNGTSNVKVLSGNGNVTTSVGGTANVVIVTATGANITGTLNATGNANVGNIGTAGLITATGNITGGNINTAGLISTTGNITGNNISGTLTTASQPNITSVGQLGSLAVTGNITPGGIAMSTGNATIGNLYVSGQTTIAGNITQVSGNSGQFFGNASTGFNALYAGLPAGFSILGQSVTNFVSQFDGYSQINNQNQSAGGEGTVDFVLTGNNGNDSKYFFDIGYAGSGYDPAVAVLNNALGNILTPNDAYMYTTGNVGDPSNMVIGTVDANSYVRFFVGGYYANAQVMQLNAPSAANTVTITGGITVTGNASVSAITNGAGNGVGNIGSSSSYFNTVFAKAATAQYADLAEKYVADADYTPGTVLMFGGDKEVTECAHDMCTRVAGVVSTNPAYLMNSGVEGEHTVELALTGRVPTKVRGPIRKGDLMVSAGDGHARAETLPQVGTVIGKALEDFDGDAGVIEVVVGKH